MTTPQAVSIPEMFGQSIEVITKPSVATFERYEDRGQLTQALIYVAITAAVAGVFGLAGGLGGFIGGIVNTMIGFLAFTGLVYTIGKSQGGTGTFDQVAYTFSLFWVPISVAVAVIAFILTITLIGILLLPLLALAAIVLNVFFGYLAVQSSMNLTQSSKIWTTLVGAAIGAWIVSAVVGRVF